jgi:hypothetical protein
MKNIRLTLKLNLAEFLEGRSLVSRTIGPNGECLMLLVDKSDVAEIQGFDFRGGMQFSHSQANFSVAADLLIVDGSYVQNTVISNLKLAYPLLQPLPNGNFLLVGRRCRMFPDGTAERNANIFSSDGKLLREMTFGDGIADVQTTEDGGIWVSYFDEGIFGNGIGVSGLVRFEYHGAKLCEFVAPNSFSPMDDCYALNVHGGDVWVYYYSSFPLVCINSAGEYEGWTTPIKGARTFAIDGRHVLFFGGYPKKEIFGGYHTNEICSLGELGSASLKNIVEYRLILPSGDRCSGAKVIGRGPLLHVFQDTSWYQVDIRNIV